MQQNGIFVVLYSEGVINMPIASRILIESACYHVITRGNQRQRVFREEKDYERYLSIMRRSKRKYSIYLYAYCLMPNHVHMLIDTDVMHNISKFMQWINRGYTAYFNSKYKKEGHLWQGRFVSKPIVKDEYLIHCAHYIEGNPVRANMVNDIGRYRWSSYRERCLLPKRVILDDLRVQL